MPGRAGSSLLHFSCSCLHLLLVGVGAGNLSGRLARAGLARPRAEDGDCEADDATDDGADDHRNDPGADDETEQPSDDATDDEERRDEAEREVGLPLQRFDALVEVGLPTVEVVEARGPSLLVDVEGVPEPRHPLVEGGHCGACEGVGLVGPSQRFARGVTRRVGLGNGLGGAGCGGAEASRQVVETTRLVLLRPLDLRHLPGDGQGGGEPLRQLRDLLLKLVQGTGLRGRPLGPGLAEHAEAHVGELAVGLDRLQDDAQVVRGGTPFQVLGEGVHALREPGVVVLQGLQPREGGLVLLRGDELEFELVLGHCWPPFRRG